MSQQPQALNAEAGLCREDQSQDVLQTGLTVLKDQCFDSRVDLHVGGGTYCQDTS